MDENRSETRLAALAVRYRAKRDPRLLGEIFDGTAPELFRLALAWCPDAASAEDALQETFLAAFTALDAYDASRPLAPFLAGILRNKAEKIRRRAGRRPDPQRLPAPADPADPAGEAAHAEDLSRLRDEIERLPEPYRAVAKLRWRYGLSPAEIADVRGEPPGTTRSLLSRALERLRDRVTLLPAIVALLGLRSTRGLAAVRKEVLRSVVAKTAAAGIAGAGVAAGGAIMAKKAIIGLAALAIFVAGATVLFSSRPPRLAPPAVELAAAPAPADAEIEAGPAASAWLPEDPGPGRGVATARLLLPGAEPDERLTAVVLGDGQVLAREQVGAGTIALRYERPKDLRDFELAVFGPGRERVWLGLSTGRDAVGALLLGRGTTYHGRLVRPDGEPIRRAVVWWNGVCGVPSDADGSFLLPLGARTPKPDAEGALPGMELRICVPGYAPWTFPARAEGLREGHTIVVPEGRRFRFRLWWLDGGTPAAGVPVALVGPRGAREAGTTDRDGFFAPAWAFGGRPIHLDVKVGEEWIRYVVPWELCHRLPVRHLYVPGPDQAMRLTVRCVEEKTGAPVSGARVLVRTTPFSVHSDVLDLEIVTGEDGAGSAAFWLLDEEVDPSFGKLLTWQAAWTDRGGRPRLATGRFDGERPVAAAGAVTLTLGGETTFGDARPLTIRVCDEEGRPLAASVLGRLSRGRIPAAVSTVHVTSASSFAPPGSPGGGPSAPAPVWLRIQGEPLPPDTPVPLTVNAPGRPAFVAEVLLGDLLRAAGSGRAIRIVAPPVTVVERWVRVLGPEGEPVPGARLRAARRGGPILSLLREADADGRVFAGDWGGAGESWRVGVVDPETGDAAVLEEMPPGLGTVEIRLRRARQMRLLVVGATVETGRGFYGRLVDAGSPVVLDGAWGKYRDGQLDFGRAVPDLYELRAGQRVGTGYRGFVGPAAEAGYRVVLEPGVNPWAAR